MAVIILAFIFIIICVGFYLIVVNKDKINEWFENNSAYHESTRTDEQVYEDIQKYLKKKYKKPSRDEDTGPK